MAAHGSDLMVGDAHPRFVGPPRLVAERLLEHVASGYETTIVEMAAPYDHETLERLLGDVKPLFDRD